MPSAKSIALGFLPSILPLVIVPNGYIILIINHKSESVEPVSRCGICVHNVVGLYHVDVHGRVVRFESVQRAVIYLMACKQYGSTVSARLNTHNLSFREKNDTVSA